MQNNQTFEKITRTGKARRESQNAAFTGKQWKREDKRQRYSNK